MMQWTLMTIMFIFNIIFMNMNHPLAMGLTLMIQTTLISMFLGFITKSFWFSYILFLIFIGGMLVMFIYMTSLASNEMFSLSMKLTSISLMFFFFLMFLMIFMDKNQLMQYSNTEMNSIGYMNSYINENSLSLNKLYNLPNNLITILLMIYLFITLIAIVKITKLFYGPLRPMFN